jgi:hypothetical protein
MAGPLLTSSFLDVSFQDGTYVFSFRRCFAEQIGLGLRPREVRFAAKLGLKAVGKARWLEEEVALILSGPEQLVGEVAVALRDVDRRLAKLAEKPMEASLVEQALGISGRERLRWTKDGRMARAGVNLIRRGNAVALSLYRVEDVARLLKQPEIIRAWREADSA